MNLNLNDNEKEYIRFATEQYIQQIRSQPHDAKNDATFSILALVDDSNSEYFDRISKMGEKLPSCTKGCSHCCHIQVGITEMEVNLILDYLKKKGREFTEEELATLTEQAKFKLGQDGDYVVSPHRQCVFLKDGLCSIYTVRPFSCRNYYVYNDPKDCDTYDEVDKGETKIAQHFNIETLPLVFAMMDVSPRGTMSELILKKIWKSK